MSAKPRVGLVGIGYWGFNLLRNLNSCGQLELVGGVDISPDATRKASNLYPHVPMSNNLDEFLAKVKPDAMVIASPPKLHHEMSLKCLRAGAHILVEKPLATSTAECEDILAVADQHKRTVMVDHTFLYHPAVELLMDKAHSGEFGNLLYYDSVRVNFGGFQATNVLWDLGPHDLSILEGLLKGRLPKKVSATAIGHLGTGVEDLCYVTLIYDDGFVGHLHLNWMAPVKIRTVLVGGNKKMAVYDDNSPTEKVKIYDKEVNLLDKTKADFRVRYRVGDMVAPAISDSEALGKMISHFADCIVNGRTPRSDGRAGARIVRILEAAALSAKGGGDFINL